MSILNWFLKIQRKSVTDRHSVRNSSADLGYASNFHEVENRIKWLFYYSFIFIDMMANKNVIQTIGLCELHI
jgi:hypothetical protein